MIYTVGNTKNYKAAIEEHGEIYKQGETIDYAGGIVFETQEDATAYIELMSKSKEWSVWGVDANWITDTYPDMEGYTYLLWDSLIIEL